MVKFPKIILLIDTSLAAGRGLVRGIAKYAHFHGPWNFYRASRYASPNLRSSVNKNTIAHFKKWSADGIISYNSTNNEQLLELSLPTIVRDRKPIARHIPKITADDAAIGTMAAEHLLEHGFKHFAFCGFDDIHWSVNRGKSFRKKIEEAGFKTQFYKQPKSNAKRSWENEQKVISEWVKSMPRPLGLFACNDDRGQQVVDACSASNRNVPEEVAVLGVSDEYVVCILSDPPLSSVALNTERAGYEAAELLARLMNGEKMASQTITIQPKYVVTRQSTSSLATEDLAVARALNFIRKNSSRKINVNDVMGSVPMSRRNLEQRFRRELGRSIHNEIVRVRTNLVARMLLETNLSISQIALQLGYTSIEHISRSFTKEKGMTAMAYRKKYGHK